MKNVLVPAMVSKKNISEDTMQFGKSKVGVLESVLFFYLHTC